MSETPAWKKWAGYGYHEWQIKERLGLDKRTSRKMPADFSLDVRELDGVRVRILSHDEAKSVFSNGARFNHRVLAECPKCGRWMSAGRLHQHLGFSSIGRRRVARPCVAEEVAS